MKSSENYGSVADKDFYKILNVERTATETEIKNAYRKLAIMYHPDRNPGNPESGDRFKEISVAYAVLSDPSRRRQYDLFGPSNSLTDFDGFDINQMGGLGRFIGALCTQIGIPIPTQIEPRVLAMAKEIMCEGAEANRPHAETLVYGQVMPGRVERQDAKFYWIDVTESQCNEGVIISCRSSSMSKFKVILFDKDGNVRLIRESAKHKRYTSAEMFFLPHDLMRISDLLNMTMLAEVDKDVPLQFHLLDGFEPDQSVRLQPGKHLFCIYGDNWFQDIKYKVKAMVAECESAAMQQIQESETKLNQYKQEMSQFKDEFLEAKTRYEAAVTKLENYGSEISALLKNREKAYTKFIETSGAKYADSVNASPQLRSGRGGGPGGMLKDIFSSVSNAISGK